MLLCKKAENSLFPCTKVTKRFLKHIHTHFTSDVKKTKLCRKLKIHHCWMNFFK